MSEDVPLVRYILGPRRPMGPRMELRIRFLYRFVSVVSRVARCILSIVFLVSSEGLASAAASVGLGDCSIVHPGDDDECVGADEERDDDGVQLADAVQLEEF